MVQVTVINVGEDIVLPPKSIAERIAFSIEEKVANFGIFKEIRRMGKAFERCQWQIQRKGFGAVVQKYEPFGDGFLVNDKRASSRRVTPSNSQ